MCWLGYLMLQSMLTVTAMIKFKLIIIQRKWKTYFRFLLSLMWMGTCITVTISIHIFKCHYKLLNHLQLYTLTPYCDHYSPLSTTITTTSCVVQPHCLPFPQFSTLAPQCHHISQLSSNGIISFGAQESCWGQQSRDVQRETR